MHYRLHVLVEYCSFNINSTVVLLYASRCLYFVAINWRDVLDMLHYIL